MNASLMSKPLIIGAVAVLLLLASAVAQHAAPSVLPGESSLISAASMKVAAADAATAGIGVDFSTRAQARAALQRLAAGYDGASINAPASSGVQSASAEPASPVQDAPATPVELPGMSVAAAEFETVQAQNVCPASPYTKIANSQLKSYPYNTVVKIFINWFRFNGSKREVGVTTTCTATALSNVVLVTAARCVATTPNATYPFRYVDAHYGWNGTFATLGVRTSQCVSFWQNYTTTQPDTAIIRLSSPMNLPRYRTYAFVSNVSPRTNVDVHQLGYAAANEQACVNSNGQLYSSVKADNITLRTGNSINRCRTVPEIWTSVSQVKGQEGACLIYSNLMNGPCIGTASGDCEDTDCVTTCPNAWGGFQAKYNLSALWTPCGIRG